MSRFHVGYKSLFVSGRFWMYIGVLVWDWLRQQSSSFLITPITLTPLPPQLLPKKEKKTHCWKTLLQVCFSLSKPDLCLADCRLHHAISSPFSLLNTQSYPGLNSCSWEFFTLKQGSGYFQAALFYTGNIFLCRSVFSGFNISNAVAPWELIAKEIPELGLDIERVL